ncbi:MAG: metallophosphoesterase family protein [Methermicoccaceae archaeon]
MVSISPFLRHVGVNAYLKHITSKSYDDDYDEATPSYSQSSVYALLQPLSAEDKKQLTGGAIDKATIKAYLPPNTAVGRDDLLTVGTDSYETWRVEKVLASRDEYVAVALSQTTLPPQYARIAIISDIHVGQADGDFAESCPKLVNDIGSSYDLVVYLGDQWETTDFPDKLNDWIDCLAAISPRQGHKFYVWGNHDWGDGDHVDEATTLMKAAGYEPEHPRIYTLGDTALVFINTQTGTISAAELSGLSDALDRLTDYSDVFVFGHIPMLHGDWQLDNKQQLRYLLSKYPNLNAYISGHDHGAVGQYTESCTALGTQYTYEAEDYHLGTYASIVSDSDAYGGQCVKHPSTSATTDDRSICSIGTYTPVRLPAGDYTVRWRLKSDEAVDTQSIDIMVYDSTDEVYLLDWQEDIGTAATWQWTYFYDFTVPDETHYLWFKTQVNYHNDDDGIAKYADRMEVYAQSTKTLKQLFSRRANSTWGVSPEGFAVLDIAPSGTRFWTQGFGDDTHLNEVEL